MNSNKNELDLDKIREIDLVSYLNQLGHQPTTIRGHNYWYLSPFRNERDPSFKINRNLNRWYDFGLGLGGNIIDFAIRYKGCTIGEFLKSMDSFSMSSTTGTRIQHNNEKSPQAIKILENKSLRHDALLNYLQSRRISIAIADRYLRELHFEINGNPYFGLGFKNQSGGYEIRNSFMKISSSPKDISTLLGNPEKVAVFEGFMDFLTFRTLHKNLDEEALSYVVLNSVALFERAVPKLESYKEIALYFDNDQTGKNLTQMALARSEKYRDESSLYRGHKDLNEWASSLGQRSSNGIGKLKIR